MSFFRRRPGRHAVDGDVFTEAVSAEPEDDEEALEEYVEGLSGEAEPERAAGPRDIGDMDDDDEVDRLDLGSLKIPRLDGVEIQMRGVQQDNVDAVVLMSGDSVLQVSAFAAPRSEGVWDDVRAELRKSILSQGGSVEEASGPYGPELQARIHTSNGPAEARFVGFDGPRWFVKCLFQGRAAADSSTSTALDDALARLVVDRGSEARPVNEPLPLTLPPELAEQIAKQAGQKAEEPGSGEAGAPPVNGSSGRQSKRSRRR